MDTNITARLPGGTSDAGTALFSDFSTHPICMHPRTAALVQTLRNDPVGLRIAQLAVASRARGTWKNYTGAAKRFVRWCSEHNEQPVPANLDVLLRYLAERSLSCTAGTLSLELTGIRYLHTSRGFPAPQHQRLDDLLRGLKRLSPPPRRKRPLRRTDVCLISDLLDRATNRRKAVRDRALNWLLFAAALRCSSAAGLNIEHVRFDARRGMEIFLERSKTDQDGDGLTIYVPYARERQHCPVHAVRAWIGELHRATGPLFVTVSSAGRLGGRISAQRINLIVKEFARELGYTPSEYGSHSMRAGFVTTAYEEHVPEHAIRHVTKHQSFQGLLPYIRDVNPWMDDTTRRLGL